MQLEIAISGKTSKCELIIDDLLNRLTREAKIAEGARVMVAALQQQKKSDQYQKTLQEVCSMQFIDSAQLRRHFLNHSCTKLIYA